MFWFVQNFIDVGAKVSVVTLIWSPLYMNMDKNMIALKVQESIFQMPIVNRVLCTFTPLQCAPI